MHVAPVRIAVPEGARRFLGGQVSGSKKDGPNDYGRERDHHTGNYEKQPHDLTVPVKRAGNPSGDIPGRWPSRGSLLSWRQTEQTSGATATQALRGASLSKRPRHHQRELFSPERVAVRSDTLGHDDVRACTP